MSLDLPTSIVREATAMVVAHDPLGLNTFHPDETHSDAPHRGEETTGIDGWEPADLDAALTTEPLEPSILTRTDGVSLLYAGRIHTIYGETESLKTWAAYVAGKQVLDAGGRLLVIDYEDVDTTFAQRLTALGIAREVLTDLDRVRFHAADSPAGHAVITAWLEWAPTLVIVDGVTAALDVEGHDPNSGTDIASWYRRILRPVSDGGACVVSLDHVAKSAEAKKKPIASVHKVNGITGAAYKAEASRPLSRAFLDPVDGLTRLYVEKDRPGGVRSHQRSDKAVADIRLTAYPDGGVSFEVAAPGSRKTSDLEKKITDHLTVWAGSTKSSLRELGNSDQIDETLMVMIREGKVRVEKSGNTHRHHLTSLDEKPSVDAA